MHGTRGRLRKPRERRSGKIRVRARMLGSRAGERRWMRMGRTIADKIPAKNALAGWDAMPGAIPRARLNR